MSSIANSMPGLPVRALSHQDFLNCSFDGVVGEISVREGEAVHGGQVVLTLDATETHANLAIIIRKIDDLTARMARLEVERDDLQAVGFPEYLLDKKGEPGRCISLA